MCKCKTAGLNQVLDLLKEVFEGIKDIKSPDHLYIRFVTVLSRTVVKCSFMRSQVSGQKNLTQIPLVIGSLINDHF